jgi:uncharacterized protein
MLTVVKRNPGGEETIRYSAKIAGHLESGIVLDAHWNNPRRDLGYTVFEPGDHFVEYFYSDRWYNIFAIENAQTDFKGWYCNVAQPALITEEYIDQIDLLLDVWIAPDGAFQVLDEDEFQADQTLTTAQRLGSVQGLHSLLALLAARGEPFQRLVQTEQPSDESLFT